MDTYRSYVSPVILATLVHVMMLAMIAGQWFDFSEPQRPQPRHLQARMIDMSSLQPDQAAVQQAAEQARAQEQARQAEQQRQEQVVAEQQQQLEQQQQQQRQEEQQRLEQQQRQQQQQREAEQQREQELVAQREAESRIRAEQERQQQADAERQRREEAERQAAAEQRRQEERRQAEERQRQEAAQAKAREEAQQREAQARAEAQKAEAEAQARAEAQRAAQAAAADAVIGDIGSYISAMLTRNWNIPATARTGMQATVEIQLMPNGEISDVRIVQSSGDLAFDRSAEQAVRRTERLPRVAEVDPILFERRLRRTQVIFRPEGLRW